MAEPESVRELVERAQAGDRGALEALAARCRPRLLVEVRGQLGARLRARVEPEDVVQEALLRACRMLERFRWQSDEHFYSWLGSIAEHVIWNVSQKRSIDRLEISRDIAARGATPSREIRREERFDRLEEAIKALPPDQREALRLARLEGLKVNEVAERMKRSPNSVSKLLARAVLALRKRVGDTESLHLPDRSLDLEEHGHEG